jgi:hypothetical protein
MVDSYVTETEAGDYFGYNPNAIEFLDSDIVEWSLQEATRIIDALPLRGDRYEPIYLVNGVQQDTDHDGQTQTLEFPRFIDNMLLDYDYGTKKATVPQKVKDACCWIALSLFSEDSEISEKSLQEAGVQSFSRGKLSVSFVQGVQDRYFGLPKRAYDLLKNYIDTTAGVI